MERTILKELKAQDPSANRSTFDGSLGKLGYSCAQIRFPGCLLPKLIMWTGLERIQDAVDRYEEGFSAGKTVVEI